MRRVRLGGVCLAVFGLVVVGGCSNHGGLSASRRPVASHTGSPRNCALDGLTVKLGHGGLAMNGDFAVLEVRDGGRQPCEMRSAITLTALGEDHRRMRDVPLLHSNPTRPAIVLASSSAGAATLQHLGDLDGLGIFLTGGNENDRGGCAGRLLIQPAFWRITIDRASQVIRNDLGRRNVARRLATCRARRSGFTASRQMPNADLPVDPHPS